MYGHGRTSDEIGKIQRSWWLSNEQTPFGPPLTVNNMLSAFAARKKAASPSPSPISIDNDLEIDSHPQTETTNLAEGAEVPKSTKFRASPPIHASSKRKQIQNDTSNPPSKRKKRNTSTTGSVALAGSRKNLMPTLIQEQNNEYQDRTLVPISRGYSPSEPVMVEGETSDTMYVLLFPFRGLNSEIWFTLSQKPTNSNLKFSTST